MSIASRKKADILPPHQRAALTRYSLSVQPKQTKKKRRKVVEEEGGEEEEEERVF